MSEVRRVGRRYYVQTPNYHFPVEPHYLLPFFQFLPMAVRVFIIHTIGWPYGHYASAQVAREGIRSIRLVSERETRALFPAGKLYKEHILGLCKSFTIYGGWDLEAPKRP